MEFTLDIGGSKTRGFLYANDDVEKIEILGGFGKAEDSDEIEKDLFAALTAFLGDRATKISAVAVNVGGKNKQQITKTIACLCPQAKISINRESEGILARQMMKMHGANVLVMAGTGCIVFSSTPQGNRVLGGWGKDYGDDGSGYSIGMKAVRYCLKELDSGMKKTSPLTQELFGWETSFFFDNIDEYAAARDEARLKIPKTREGIAALTKTVVACAQRGCPLSQRVLNETGEDIAELVVRAIKADGLTNPVVAINGGVTNFYPLWKDAFLGKLQKEGQQAKVICFNDGIDKALQQTVQEI